LPIPSPLTITMPGLVVLSPTPVVDMVVEHRDGTVTPSSEVPTIVVNLMPFTD
jgi:hypothetical protein